MQKALFLILGVLCLSAAMYDAGNNEINTLTGILFISGIGDLIVYTLN